MNRMLLFLSISIGGGCWSPGARPAPPQVLSTSVDGDQPVPPTPSVVVRLSALVDAQSLGAVALVRGEADVALVTQLGKPPLSAKLLGELVAADVTAMEDRVQLVPRRVLAPSARYTLIVGAALRAGGASLGRPVLRAFTTGTLADAAPVLALVDPPDGAAGVVRNLRAMKVAWSKPMPAAQLQVVGDDGRVVPSTTMELGDGPSITLGAVLDGGRRFSVRAPPGLADAEGRAPFGDAPAFSTGDELRTAPPEIAGLALEPGDRCLVVRFSTSRPTRAELCVADACADEAESASHALGALLPDPSDGWTLRAWDESTAPEASASGQVALPAVPLVLTEVLTDPLGPRTSQQWIELLNVGDAPVELGGLLLKTASGQDVLPSGTLSSGGYAVVVPSGFSDDGLDVMPAPGALLVRLANARLGGRGIRVGGEPVWLEDGAGAPITRWGGFPVESAPGQSLWRQPFTCDLPASFRPGTPTPGGPPS
jgi:hypothetical protein